MIEVIGTIIRRKSYGKWLAFATLKVLSIKNNLNDKVLDLKDDDNSIRAETDAEDWMSSIGLETLTINDETIQTLRIAFQRDSPHWKDPTPSTKSPSAVSYAPFPAKNSLLPYGAKVRVWLKERQPDKKSGCNQQVCFWNMMEDPRLIALEKAKQGRRRQQQKQNSSSNNGNDCENGDDGENNAKLEGGEEGVLLNEYLKNRGLFYLQYNDCDFNQKMKEQKNSNSAKKAKEEKLSSAPHDTNTSATISSEKSTTMSKSPHGDKKAKSLRAKIFASWLVEEFGSDLLKRYNGVLDVAGGKGQLSVELAILGAAATTAITTEAVETTGGNDADSKTTRKTDGTEDTDGSIQCTIIDPFIRGRSGAEGKFLPNKQMKRIQKVRGKIPNHIAKYFIHTDEDSNNLVRTCSCVVGLHPDQPTEDIVDLALLNNKPFAVIPCCVFPCLFPMRTLKTSGKFVNTYDEFIQYLMEKDDRLKITTLNFEGKNKVIYFKG